MSAAANNKTGFSWKPKSNKLPGSIKPVYGAKHPPNAEAISMKRMGGGEQGNAKEKHSDSFTNFDNSTNDAWDDTEDDLLKEINKQTRKKQLEEQEKLDKAKSGKDQPNKNTNDGAKVVNIPAFPKLPALVRRKPPDLGSVSSSDPMPPANEGIPVNLGPGVARRQEEQGAAEAPRPITPIRLAAMPMPDREATKLKKFGQLLAMPNTDLDELRKLSWSGIPREVRPTTWRLLLGYLPANVERRSMTLERKRAEYFSFVDQYFHTRENDVHADTYRQIQKDLPRMNIPYLRDFAEEIFERILFIWAIRHPASGYVQGINDLVTPFFVVFLSEFVDDTVEKLEDYDITKLAEDKLRYIEADSFWCMSKLLDGIQDNYTFAQPGIQIKVNQLKELTKRIDAPLNSHLERHQVEYLQFSFRWMNNLLMREMPLQCTIRLWDTYMCEPEGFSVFHLYVCAALLSKWSQKILHEDDFQGILIFLQNLPTGEWMDEDISLLLAEAYRLRFTFADAPNHLYPKK